MAAMMEKWTCLHVLMIILSSCYFRGSNSVEVSNFFRVYNYEDFSSTSPFRHSVPEDSSEAVWGFQVDNEHQDSCDDEEVIIAVQYGSIPAFKPLDEKFPDNYFADRLETHIFTVKSNNVSLEVTLNNPLPGPHYGIAVLPRPNGKIRPSDLFVTCVYRLRVTFSTKPRPRIQELSTQVETQVIISAQSDVPYRFFVPLYAHHYTVTLKNCQHGNNTDCPVTMVTRGQNLPGDGNTYPLKECKEGDIMCEVEDGQPETDMFHYLQIQSELDNDLNATLDIQVKECSKWLNQTSECLLAPQLDRLTYNSKFKTKFGHLTGSSMQVKDVMVPVVENRSMVVPFQILDGEDNGGSMVAQLKLKQVIALESSDLQVRVDVCLSREKFAVQPEIAQCQDGYYNYLNDTATVGQAEFKVIVPYPKHGLWFLSLVLRCFKPATDPKKKFDYLPCGNLSSIVVANVTTDACVDGGCSGHGRCFNYLNGMVLHSTCRCTSGWRGFDCSDGQEVRTEMNQLLEVLLLTLSNIFFVPAILLALYRRHYVETLVYTYTMIFSTLYHACDGQRTEGFKFCPVNLELLSVCDFLGSATCIWVTLVAMVRPPLRFKPVMQVAGPLLLLIGVMYRKTSAFLFIVPAGLGLIMIWISWVCRCCYRHKCYPTKKKYLVCLLPGVLVAGVGLFLFAYLQNKDNYMYLHSLWHVCLTVSILFLLPPAESRDMYKVRQTNGVQLGSTYHPIRGHEETAVV